MVTLRATVFNIHIFRIMPKESIYMDMFLFHSDSNYLPTQF